MPAKPTNTVTIRDVARLADVSVATVSRVLNQTAAIAPETEARVRAAIESLRFTPKAAAQNLSNQKTNVIGLLLGEIGWEHFFPPMLRGIEAGCFENGYELLIHSTRHVPPPGARTPVGDHNTDGILVFIDSLADAEIRRLAEKRFPLVLMHRTPPAGLALPHIVFENKDGARKMTDHLIEAHGYRRIAFLTGPKNNEDALWRERGYRESLLAHGLPVDERLILPGEFDEDIASQTVARMLQEGPAVDAIFAADDDSAYGAIRALYQAGSHLPTHLPVVGFDDSPTSRLITPPLTTVRAPIEEAGYRAAHRLVAAIRAQETGGDPAEPVQILLPTEVVIRRSCGCA